MKYGYFFSYTLWEIMPALLNQGYWFSINLRNCVNSIYSLCPAISGAADVSVCCFIEGLGVLGKVQ